MVMFFLQGDAWWICIASCGARTWRSWFLTEAEGYGGLKVGFWCFF
jgi:hypothetical protein